MITPVIEENLFTQVSKITPTQVAQPSSVSSQKKPHTRLRLNPDAPLFSNTMTTQSEPQTQGAFNSLSQMPAGFGKQGFESQQTGINKQGFDNTQFNPHNIQSNNMLFNTSNFPQNITSEQGITSSRFNMQNQAQDYKLTSTMGRAQGQMQQGAPADFIPPGLGLGGQGMQGSHGMMNYPNFPPQMFQQSSDPSSKNRGLQSENKSQIYQQEFPSKNVLEHEEHAEQVHNILPADLQFDDEFNPEEKSFPEELKFQPETGAPSILKRGRENRPANLYTAVLSGRMREDSASNSPSLQNLQNKYFSASTPRSAYEQTVDTPLSQNNDFMPDDSSNPPLSDDMIENFKLEDHLGELVDFAKTYNGSR